VFKLMIERLSLVSNLVSLTIVILAIIQCKLGVSSHISRSGCVVQVLNLGSHSIHHFAPTKRPNPPSKKESTPSYPRTLPPSHPP
jgi:hypothetical protein